MNMFETNILWFQSGHVTNNAGLSKNIESFFGLLYFLTAYGQTQCTSFPIQFDIICKPKNTAK